MPVATVAMTAVHARVGLAGTVAVTREGLPPMRDAHRGQAVPNRCPGMPSARRHGQRWKRIRPKPPQNRRPLVLADVPSPHRVLPDDRPPVPPDDATASRRVPTTFFTASDQRSDWGPFPLPCQGKSFTPVGVIPDFGESAAWGLWPWRHPRDCRRPRRHNRSGGSPLVFGNHSHPAARQQILPAWAPAPPPRPGSTGLVRTPCVRTGIPE